MLHILYIFAYSAFSPRYFYCSYSMFVITKKKRKRRQRITFLSTIILMLIYFFSFGPCQCQSSLTNTHIHFQLSLTTRRQAGPYGTLLFLFFLPELSYGFLFSLFIYILSCSFFLPHSLVFFFFFAVCLDHSGRRRRINLREHSTINK